MQMFHPARSDRRAGTISSACQIMTGDDAYTAGSVRLGRPIAALEAEVNSPKNA